MTSVRELKKFGLLFGVVFGVVAWRFAPWLGFLSAAFFLLGTLRPLTLKPIYRFWMGLGLILGKVMTTVLLSLLYFLILTPIAVFGRLFRASFLDLTFYRPESTYWLPKEKRGGHHSEQQF